MTSVIVLLAVLWGLFLYVFQERLLFFPETLAPQHVFRFEGSFPERWLDLKGQKIHSLHFQQKGRAQGLILYFHGNAGSLDTWGHVARELVERTNFDVWMVDCPGFARREGNIQSEEQLHQLAVASWASAAMEYDRIVIYGRSTGTGIATRLAAEKNADGLILENPSKSLVSLARDHLF